MASLPKAKPMSLRTIQSDESRRRHGRIEATFFREARVTLLAFTPASDMTRKHRLAVRRLGDYLRVAIPSSRSWAAPVRAGAALPFLLACPAFLPFADECAASD